MRIPSVLAVSYFFAMSMIVASSCKKDDKPEEEIPLTATEVKDIAAGAVLIASVAATMVLILIFKKYLFE